MKKIKNDFVSQEPREYRFKMGKLLASSLSGFIAGAVLASIFWILLFLYYRVAFSGF